MLQSRQPQMGLSRVEINLGRGSTAASRWARLDAVLRRGKQHLRSDGNHDDARMIYLWQLSSRYRIGELSHWTLELDGEEWQALSRALRCTGTEGRSMLAWLSLHKVNTHG